MCVHIYPCESANVGIEEAKLLVLSKLMESYLIRFSQIEKERKREREGEREAFFSLKPSCYSTRVSTYVTAFGEIWGGRPWPLLPFTSIHQLQKPEAVSTPSWSIAQEKLREKSPFLHPLCIRSQVYPSGTSDQVTVLLPTRSFIPGAEKKPQDPGLRQSLLGLTWVRPSCKQPPGVIGWAGRLEFNLSVNGVSGCDDWDWTAIILEKKARSPAQSSVLVNNICSLLFALLSSSGGDAWSRDRTQPQVAHRHIYE